MAFGNVDPVTGEVTYSAKIGADGYSPSAKVTQLSDGATISITDKDGTTTATVKNVAGELIPSVSKYQTGTVITSKTSWVVDDTGEVTVTFDEAMPDTDYSIALNTYTNGFSLMWFNKTVNGFTVRVMNNRTDTVNQAITVLWQAFKLMTDAALLADEEQIAQNTEDIATLKSEVIVKSAYTAGNGTTVSATLNNVAGTSWNPIYVFYDRNIYLISIGTNTDTLSIYDVVNNTGTVLSSATLTKVSGNTYTLSLTFSTAIYGRCFIHYR